jgi:type III pantothenate kinase
MQQMKLVIDIGNTLAKIAVFNESEMIDFIAVPNVSIESLEKLLNTNPHVHSAIIASVSKIDETLISWLHTRLKVIFLDASTALPFKNKYQSTTTLGYDRIAAVAGASSFFPGYDVLVINAGTCITYDLITYKNEYLGGSISPGIYMRFKAMHTFTSKLPFIKPAIETRTELIGKNTETSIRSGVQNGVLHEVDGIIDKYKSLFHELKVVVSGGDYKYFDKTLKNNIFATPNIVLKGLNRIHDFNEKK